MNEKTRTHPSRRRFLKTTAGLLTPLVLPSTVWGQEGKTAPNERIALGFIGIGAMGQGHLHHMRQYDDAQIVAVCDVDQWRRETAKRNVEETYATSRPGGTYRGCETYVDLRELLDRTDIDAVVIATGDNWHATASVMAAKSGKDVYCEKPISKTIVEARAMVSAARRYGRVFQCGLQQRSTPEFQKACRLILAGRLGKLQDVYIGHPGTNGDVNLTPQPVPDGLDWDLWLGPAPWRPFHGRFHRYGRPPGVVPWHFCRDFGGGNLTSNAVHAFDVVQWALGMDASGPTEIIPPETSDVPSLTYLYPNDVRLQVVNGRLEPSKHDVPKGWNPGTRLQNFGALYVGESGWIHVGRRGFLEASSTSILEEDPIDPAALRSVTNHHQNWLDCIRSRKLPSCDVEIGCRSTTVSHLGCIAHWTGRRLRWDPTNEAFLDDNEANLLRSRVMREPWRV